MVEGGEYRYRPARWLPGPHAQTLWGRFARSRAGVAVEMECFATDDGDGLELHHLDAPAGAPRVLMLHGLEGSHRSHYVAGVLKTARARQWGASVLVFRGCGSTPNLARRFYHSGETQDLAAVFQNLSTRWKNTPWFLVGVSLGGNVLLKWLGEVSNDIDHRIIAAAAISVPFDLEAGSRFISRGFSRVYEQSFLRSLRRKALAKLGRYPALFDNARLNNAKTIYDFDDAVTAPVHGFASAHDYYERSSALRFLTGIRVPTLLLSARDDPFLPRRVLDEVERKALQNTRLMTEFHERGGHAGFVGGRWPWAPEYYAERRVFDFFETHWSMRGKRNYDLTSLVEGTRSCE
jgi:predicted alpha/beta-fold hydrolase